MNNDIKEFLSFSKRKLIKIIFSQTELIDNQENLIQGQQKQIDILERLVKNLESEMQILKKNSSNSSKPPSSDNFPPNKNQSLREKSDRKSGGQNGHNGTTRNQTSTPDKIIACRPLKCEHCGKDLSKHKGKVISKRQVADIPPVKPEIIEYQQEEVKCACGHCNKGEFIAHIKAPMQIGQNLKSFIVYLSTCHYLPYQRLTQLIKDLLNMPLSQGTAVFTP